VVQRVIANALTGERIVIRRNAAETDGALLEFDLYLPAGGHVPAGHVHPEQRECFTVVEGALEFHVGGRTIYAGAGESVLVTPGTPHWFGNKGQTEAHARVEVRPALRMEELLATSERLSTPGQTLATRLKGLTLLVCEFQRELAVPFLPRCVVRLAQLAIGTR
jgi:quercetin dioxygenase-like cupin family protein